LHLYHACVAHLHVALAPLISHIAFVTCIRMLHLRFAFACCTLELRVCTIYLHFTLAPRACVAHPRVALVELALCCACALRIVRCTLTAHFAHLTSRSYAPRSSLVLILKLRKKRAFNPHVVLGRCILLARQRWRHALNWFLARHIRSPVAPPCALPL
jgi:hypothetical protein